MEYAQLAISQPSIGGTLLVVGGNKLALAGLEAVHATRDTEV